MLNRRAFSDVIQDANTSTRKEDARRVEFVRIGQVHAYTYLLIFQTSGFMLQSKWRLLKSSLFNAGSNILCYLLSKKYTSYNGLKKRFKITEEFICNVLPLSCRGSLVGGRR